MFNIFFPFLFLLAIFTCNARTTDNSELLFVTEIDLSLILANSFDAIELKLDLLVSLQNFYCKAWKKRYVTIKKIIIIKRNRLFDFSLIRYSMSSRLK